MHSLHQVAGDLHAERLQTASQEYTIRQALASSVEAARLQVWRGGLGRLLLWPRRAGRTRRHRLAMRLGLHG